jgi:hypothetical protein
MLSRLGIEKVYGVGDGDGELGGRRCGYARNRLKVVFPRTNRSSDSTPPAIRTHESHGSIKPSV